MPSRTPRRGRKKTGRGRFQRKLPRKPRQAERERWAELPVAVPSEMAGFGEYSDLWQMDDHRGYFVVDGREGSVRAFVRHLGHPIWFSRADPEYVYQVMVAYDNYMSIPF